MKYAIAIAMMLLAFAGGYRLGRIKGKEQGFNEGELFAPLEIRRQCIEDGWCHICGHRVSTERRLTRSGAQDRI